MFFVSFRLFMSFISILLGLTDFLVFGLDCVVIIVKKFK